VGIDVRPTQNLEEFGEAVQAISQYFGSEPDPEGFERFSRVLPLDRMLAARENGRIIGGAGGFPFEMSVPGGRVRCAGTTVVGVYPTHRRRGVLRTMMRAHLDDAHERGEPIAALWASEETIYGRFGYGRAAFAGDISIPRERVAFAHPHAPNGVVRLVEGDEAQERFPPLWDALAQVRPGVHSRTPDWWELRIVRDDPNRRGGGGPKRFLLVERDGDGVAYAIYRHHMSWEDGSTSGRIQVIEAIGNDAEANADVWRYLLDIDWVATIASSLIPPDHPLFFLLAETRRMRYRAGDSLWVRLLDVGAALSARRYAAEQELVFEVTDSFCDWNAGRWRLAGGTAERTDADPDLRLDARELGATYLGGIGFRQLAQAGLVEEKTPGAIDRADAAFRHGLHPWGPEIF
jgi:predicted acetyltransferase